MPTAPSSPPRPGTAAATPVGSIDPWGALRDGQVSPPRVRGPESVCEPAVEVLETVPRDVFEFPNVVSVAFVVVVPMLSTASCRTMDVASTYLSLSLSLSLSHNPCIDACPC